MTTPIEDFREVPLDCTICGHHWVYQARMGTEMDRFIREMRKAGVCPNCHSSKNVMMGEIQAPHEKP